MTDSLPLTTNTVSTNTEVITNTGGSTGGSTGSDGLCNWDISSYIPSNKNCSLLSLTVVVCGALGYYYYKR